MAGSTPRRPPAPYEELEDGELPRSQLDVGAVAFAPVGRDIQFEITRLDRSELVFVSQ